MAIATPPLQLDHLDYPGVRERMVADWTLEVEDLERRLPRERWPFGRGLTAAGWDHYLASMPVALREKDMAWLAATMNDRSLWMAYGNRMRKGHMEQYRVNIPDAAVKLAHGEYSIAYTRAVAGLAIEGGIPTCEVYRAGYAANPRWACTCLEGPGVSCTAVLEGHRSYFTGLYSEVAIPAGPHCHHSIRIREWL